MEIFITILALFAIGGFGGFVLELFFRRYVSQKRWVKPGFLAGPFIPLYGFGMAMLYAFDAYIPWASISPWPWLNTVVEIIVLGISLTLIELVAGLIFVKGMKIRLWDYSKQWGNFMGLVCPLFSFFWLIGAALYVLLLGEPMVAFGGLLAANYLSFTYPLGIFTGVLCIDLGYSLGVVKKLRSAIEDSRVVAHWEKTKVILRDYYKELKEKQSFLLPFVNAHDRFREAIAKYLERKKAEGKEAGDQ